MASKPLKLDRFDPLLPAPPYASPWSNGQYVTDEATLCALLSSAIGSKQASGIFAAAVDVWVAHELRRSGFNSDEVWPRAERPRVLTPELRSLLDVLGKRKGQELMERIQRETKVGPNEAKVLGSVYAKQADVLISSWPRGMEVLVSTKTMLSSYGKNLRNRFEEAYGDAKNLRGRFPLAAIGFVFAVRSDIPASDLVFARDMLRKLRMEKDVYDCCSLLIVDWEGPQLEESNSEGIDLADEVESNDVDAIDPATVTIVSDKEKGGDVSAEAFMDRLIDAVLSRTPADYHTEVRSRRDGETAIAEGEIDPDSVIDSE